MDALIMYCPYPPLADPPYSMLALPPHTIYTRRHARAVAPLTGHWSALAAAAAVLRRPPSLPPTHTHTCEHACAQPWCAAPVCAGSGCGGAVPPPPHRSPYSRVALPPLAGRPFRSVPVWEGTIAAAAPGGAPSGDPVSPDAPACPAVQRRCPILHRDGRPCPKGRGSQPIQCEWQPVHSRPLASPHVPLSRSLLSHCARTLRMCTRHPTCRSPISSRTRAYTSAHPRCTAPVIPSLMVFTISYACRAPPPSPFVAARCPFCCCPVARRAFRRSPADG